MAGNTFGTLFTVTSFGESHGPAIGAIVDGCPPGLALSAADLQPDLDRRRPGHVTLHDPAPRGRRGAHIVRGVRGGDHGHTDWPADREHGPAQPRLRGHRRPYPPGARRLQLHAQVRSPRLPRRRAFIGARDGDARGRRRDCQEVSGRSRHTCTRLPAAVGAYCGTAPGLGRGGAQPVLLPRSGARPGNGSLHGRPEQAWRLDRRAHQCGCRRRAAGAGGADLRSPRCGHRGGDDGDQRGQGRGDRRRFLERDAARQRAPRPDYPGGLPQQ
jgi:hypothetical protein